MKNKRKRIIIISIILVLLILFIPIKLQYRDGGTIEYKALAYKVIKWHRIMNNGTIYESTDVYWFPNNMHSLDYYAPIRIPSVNLLYKDKIIICNSGTYSWEEVVDGKTKWEEGLSIEHVFMKYNEVLKVTDDEQIKIDTSYEVFDVKYTIYNKEYEDKNTEITPIYKDLKYNKNDKTLDLSSLENDIYIVKFKIKEKNNEVNYSFKVEINK